jgi:xylulokinase
MLAAAATGVHESIPAAAKAMSATAAHFEPDPGRSATYDRLYEAYRDIYPALRSVFAKLAAVGAQ